MKKLILTIAAAVTLMSCSPQDGFLNTFEGAYINYETTANGITDIGCDREWIFNNSVVTVRRIADCEQEPESFTRPFYFDANKLYISQIDGSDIVYIEYPYTVEANGDLTLTLFTGDYTVVYYLTR